MREINNGGPAFPIPLTDDQEQEWNRSMGGVSANGMSLRDYFAAKAMQGYCARDGSIDCIADDIAADAYAIADAMLAARDERP